MGQVKLMLEGQDNYYLQEAFKTLRTNLLFCGKEVRTIVFTSSRENEGKSSVSMNVAKSFAEFEKNVLLIDADMRKSVMVGRNTISSDQQLLGLSEMLTGQCGMEEAVQQTQYPGLEVIFSGQYPPNPSELLGSEDFKRFVKECREKYDYVIIDTPPLGQVIDAAMVAAFCDGAVLVLSDTTLSYRFVRGVIDQLEKSGCKILGVVRNIVEEKSSRYGKYYGKYKKYGKYGKYGGYGAYGSYGSGQQASDSTVNTGTQAPTLGQLSQNRKQNRSRKKKVKLPFGR
ncbi:MAG: CpsD/CapB family tyrosine-protein kinase [Firmicutes bacterium]|nr:CpsD/CapB family tyrosine-protein kinase [Bacillota bacterium]